MSARKTVVEFISDEEKPPRCSKAERDAEICRLWQARWSGGKIAEHLDLTTSAVYNVVRKKRLVRKPRGVVQRIAFADAPIEAWQQAMLPEIEKVADAAGIDDVWRRASIILLLRSKPYASLPEFEAWAREVTGYDLEEIALFLERAKNGHILAENGQPDPLAYAVAEEPENSDLALILMAGVLRGVFNRTADDMYTAAPDLLQESPEPVALPSEFPAGGP